MKLGTIVKWCFIISFTITLIGAYLKITHDAGAEALLTIGIVTVLIFIASAIATNEAIIFIKKHFPKNTEIFVAAIDLELTAQSYIVPGLGDAGDLAYGVKI